MSRTKVMVGNALRLSAENYGDSTGFVQLMQANEFDDIIINGPVKSALAARALIGDKHIVLPPTDGIIVGWTISFTGISHLYTVTNVKQITADPGGLPFCSCNPRRILPPAGIRMSTIVCLAPNLEVQVELGQPVYISVGFPSVVIIPPIPKSRGRVT